MNPVVPGMMMVEGNNSLMTFILSIVHPECPDEKGVVNIPEINIILWGSTCIRDDETQACLKGVASTH
jgi:hypothetical protein